MLGEIGAIVILFMAGLEMTPKEFLRGGKASFTVGTLGVVVPFFVGLLVFQMFGFDAYQSMLIATALTATSIAISIQVLNEFGKLRTPEARLIIGAAVVDDILAIAVLSVVISMGGGDMSDIDPQDVMITVLQVLGIFAGMLLVSVLLMPRLMNQQFWKGKGSIEAIATASFFGGRRAGRHSGPFAHRGRLCGGNGALHQRRHKEGGALCRQAGPDIRPALLWHNRGAGGFQGGGSKCTNAERDHSGRGGGHQTLWVRTARNCCSSRTGRRGCGSA